MKNNIKDNLRQAINSVFSVAGLKIVRTHGYKDYIKFRDTLSDAEKAGLSVGDYIEAKYNTPGAYKITLEKMAELGVFAKMIDRVCEIGPGSGRYLDETFRYCKPKRYEIYETANNWAEWLVKRYGVIAQSCDGKSLAETPSSSIDLVQAHKVFPGLPFFTIIRYFAEMTRVVSVGGKVVFDILNEDCMDDETVVKWLDKKTNVDSWDWHPTLVPKKYVVDYFTKRGLSLQGSFFVNLRPGKTECFVFSN